MKVQIWINGRLFLRGIPQVVAHFVAVNARRAGLFVKDLTRIGFLIIIE